MSVPPSASPSISLNLFSESLASPAPGCIGQGSTNIPPAVEGQTPLGDITSTSLAQAYRDLAFRYEEGGRTTYTVPELNNGGLRVYDFNDDGLIDCATIYFIIQIKYVEWTNVGSLSRCVQDEWNRFRGPGATDGVIEIHERQHRDIIRSVWGNAHTEFVDKRLADIDSIIDRLVQRETEAQAEFHVYDEENHLTELNRCCSGATYDAQSGQCRCTALGAAYNEQGGTANNPNGGCQCPEGKEPILNRFVFPPAEECRDKCQFGRNPITEICRPAPVACPPCDSSRNFQCINGSCQCAPGWRLINGWCWPPQTCHECSNLDPCCSDSRPCPPNLALSCQNGKCYPTYAEDPNCRPGQNCCKQGISSCYNYVSGGRCILPGGGNDPSGGMCPNDCP
jgi:hypothetical protein